MTVLLEKIYDKFRYSPLNNIAFGLRVAAHRLHTPPRAAADRAWVEALHNPGGFVTHLNDLDLPITTEFRAAVDAVLPTLPDRASHLGLNQPGLDPLLGRNTALHCFAVDGPELLRRYSALVLFGLEERMLDIIEDYFGLPVALTAVSLRKDIGGGVQLGTRYWHLDTEDVKVIRMMVYLNDISMDNGPFEFISRALSQSVRTLRKRAFRSAGDPIRDDEMRQHIPESQWLPITGPAGTVLLVDNALCYHHGKTHDSERTVMIYTYTSRHPRYPRLNRNTALDARLSERQRSCMFLSSN